MSSVKVRIMLVTPDMARRWLATKNEFNRAKSETAVSLICDDINSGHYYVTNQGIGFDTDDNLLDGQTRLEAVVRSGKAVEMAVFTGLDPAAIDVIDKGRPRRWFHNKQIAAAKSGGALWRNPREVEGHIKAVQLLRDNVIRKYTDPQLDALGTVFRDGLKWWDDEGEGIRFTPLTGALVYAFQTSPASCRALAQSVARPIGLSARSPAYCLQRLYANRNGIDRRSFSMMVLRAVRHHMAGTSVDLLKATESDVVFFGRAYEGLIEEAVSYA